MLKALEIIYIRRYNPKFNFTIGGNGVLGFKHSEETKKKISESKKGKNHLMFGKHHSEESIKKMSKAKKGKKLSEETKKKLSKANKEKNNPMFGKHHSEESMEKISKAKNSSGYYRVYKHKNKNSKQGFYWEYRWYDKGGKRKKLSSVSIEKLEKKVKEKGLIWKKITN